MFCHQYPIRTCVASNGKVRSSCNNVASSSDGDQSVSRDCDYQHQGGRELGLSGMGNICESLINIVTNNKLKMLFKLEPKGTWLSTKILLFFVADRMPSVKRRALTHSGTHVERGKPVTLPLRVCKSQDKQMELWVKEDR
jgi:hypothetical protein